MITKNKLALMLSLAISIFFIAPFTKVKAAESIKIGIMLPYSGAFADLGDSIEKGFMLYSKQKGNKFAGKNLEFVKLDDESSPPKAVENANKLVKGDKVDILLGSVHSGVAMGMAKVAMDNGVLLMVPNAGAAAITGSMCAKNIYRSSFTNWQAGYVVGDIVMKAGHKKVVTITWKYAAGDESVGGFKDSFIAKGGMIMKELSLPFPNVEFQALLTEIASIKPDAVYTFFSGAGAVEFVKDYMASGLNKTIPLYGSGFITEGVLEAQGADAEGLVTALYYGDGLNTPRDNEFRAAYKKAYNQDPDVFAVQGYDAAMMLDIGLTATKGDVKDMEGFSKALRQAPIPSPRGNFTLSASHNPIQDFYMRKVIKGKNQVTGIAVKALADPAVGCKMQ